MIIKSFALPEPMIEGLKKESTTTGLPVSEIVRRAIDNYLEGNRRYIVYNTLKSSAYATNDGTQWVEEVK